MTASDFPFHGFSDPARAGRTVIKLHEVFIASGSVFPVEEFSRALAGSLERVPDADRAVTNLLRFVEATLSAATLFNDLLAYPVLMEVLMTMLSSSQYFADVLVRDPELFRWITASDALVKPRSKEFFREDVQRTLRVFHKPEKKLDSLRRLYRREILRIGARDILGAADLATITEELSYLADALVDASCTVAHQQLQERFPDAPNTPYAVIGLGKLGGCELNYSSDIDILFVYKNEGEVKDARGGTRTHHEYFNAFVEKVVQNLSRSSAEGHLYRVDLRLRPESGAGPLARSAASYLLYYESRGALWERQMLLKARAIAGDLAFGEAFIHQLEPFIFPRTFFQNPKEYIARIKARIEAAVAGEENVKLRAGGIRDIEFIVQALQLLNGGKNKSVRERNTLKALQRLTEASLMSEDERCTLEEAYVFFRTLEHRLQTMLNTQTYELPKDAADRAILAKKMGLRSAEELERENERRLASVREIFDSVVNVEVASSVGGLSAVLDGDAGLDAAARMLQDHGFADPLKAAKNLSSMIFGSSMFGSRELDVRVREAFREVADVVFGEIATTPSPDLTLNNLALLSASHVFPEQLYSQLKDERFRKMLLTVCSISPRFAKALANDPLLLETLATDPQSLAGVQLKASKLSGNLVALKTQEELRAGIRYVLGITSLSELTAELTQLADRIMTLVLKREAKKFGRGSSRFAIFALGKYGSGEMTFDADLDVVFVGDARQNTTKDRLEQLARAIVRRMSEIGEGGRLYEVDARLRPEGRNAPLVVDKNAYLAYLYTRASLWERQSLTRFRFVAGNARLGEDMQKKVEEFVYDSPLPPDWIHRIVAMRKKTETRSRVRSSDLLDIKLGAGGMVDIEFLAQMLQMYGGRHDPALRSVAGVARIDQLLARIARGKDAAMLTTAYQLYRHTETMMRIGLDEKGSILPGGENLSQLARLLGYATGVELYRHLSATMNDVRQSFLHLATTLSQYTAS